jgi:hypothetical protein
LIGASEPILESDGIFVFEAGHKCKEKFGKNLVLKNFFVKSEGFFFIEGENVEE